MLQKIKQQYYEMGFNLLSGIVVDKELKNQLTAILEKAKQEISNLIKDNPDHYMMTNGSYVYPFGKQTDFNYKEPPRMFDLSLEQRLHLLDAAFAVKEIEHLFVSEENMKLDDIKAQAQRAIEDEMAERK
jgi:hypothetical protein